MKQMIYAIHRSDIRTHRHAANPAVLTTPMVLCLYAQNLKCRHRLCMHTQCVAHTHTTVTRRLVVYDP